jgi:hypothetical protein
VPAQLQTRLKYSMAFIDGMERFGAGLYGESTLLYSLSYNSSYNSPFK